MRIKLTSVRAVLVVSALLACVMAIPALGAPARGPIRFEVTLSKSVAPSSVSGRLFVMMAPATADNATGPLQIGFDPSAVWLAAEEVTNVQPGQTLEFDADQTAFPAGFSTEKPGAYRFMALLDQNHSFAYDQQDAGDLYGSVVTVGRINPAQTAPVALRLDKVTPERIAAVVSPDVQTVAFVSPMLSKFWHHPVTVRAVVILPPSHRQNPTRTYGTSYIVTGFGGSYRDAYYNAPSLLRKMAAGKIGEVARVFLDASFSTGHTVFANSANNGPWGDMLTQELIPYLEAHFPLKADPRARFLTGHSSGGWSTLWLQVNYPDFFGGTWSSSPDPVDLRSFTGVDVTPGSTENMYYDAQGHLRNLVREDGKDLASLKSFVLQEQVEGSRGGQFRSFEYVWSQPGPDGLPMQEFERKTGVQNPAVQRQWQKYDIDKLLADHWATLGPKLPGKLHLYCGSADTFHLNEAFVYLQAFLKTHDPGAEVEMVPGRDHFTIFEPAPEYPQGLEQHIDDEMVASLKANGLY